MKILVRNLSRKLTEQQLRALFVSFGEVSACTVVLDDETGISKGFGFVEMPVAKAAHKAIAMLNGKQVQQVVMRVKAA
jgi:RNA recognition motif-containing protein